ncbi:MAG: hypothetical protein HXY22_01340 [Alphaproteobacteria bacterium]|nr:hypothetical protein [Alphaproteobacteria bacterium]
MPKRLSGPAEARRPRFVHWLLAAYNIAVLIAASLAINLGWQHPPMPLFPLMLSLLGLWFLAVFAMVLVHEFGHAFFAVAGGWHIHLIGIGPIQIRPDPFRVRLGYLPVSGDVGGYVLAWPLSARRRREGAVPYYAGGAIASAFGAGLSILLALTLPAGSAERAWLTGFSILSFFQGAIFNLIPMRLGTMRSDGQAIVDHVFGSADDLEEAIQDLSVKVLSGVRPRDWDGGLVARLAQIPPEHALRPAVLEMLFAWHFDRGDIDGARRVLATMDEAIAQDGDAAKPFLVSFQFTKAFFIAHVDGDGEGALAILKTLPNAPPWRSLHWRVRAAIAIALKNKAEALLAVRRFQQSLRGSFYVVPSEDDWELARELARRAQAL